MWLELYTMNMAYQDITQGERPWNALGDFLNYWLSYASDRRYELVADAIQEPEESIEELHRWAVFCAASVEYLCALYDIPCPEWVHNPVYKLPKPWFKGLGAQKSHVQVRLIEETPEPFTKRNIYCGNRMFLNKYEVGKLHSISSSP